MTLKYLISLFSRNLPILPTNALPSIHADDLQLHDLHSPMGKERNEMTRDCIRIRLLLSFAEPPY